MVGIKNELVQCLDETAVRLLAVERTISVVPKGAEEAMEKFKLYVVYSASKGYHKERVTIQDT